MAVVPAFTSIVGTDQAGMTAYYRAPGCNTIKMADILPVLSKITHYEPEYIIGEILVWDTGSQSALPNNCTMVRIIVYNDGWICAWFDKTTTNQNATSSASFVDSYTLSGWGSTLEYNYRYNGCQLKITGSTDPECPVDTVFTICNTDHLNGQILVHDPEDLDDYHFNNGYSYNTEIYMSNGQFPWYQHTSYESGNPADNSNRLYQAIYQIWQVLKFSSNSTNTAEAFVPEGYAWGDDGGVWTDFYWNYRYLGEPHDFFPLSTTPIINDGCYYGNGNKFSDIYVTMRTAGAGNTVVWEYWNGSIWAVLSAIDGTAGYTQTGHIIFIPPEDWVPKIVNGSPLGYYIRSRCSVENWSVVPKAAYIKLYIQNNIQHTDAELGLYNYEFTEANYVLLCGKMGGEAFNNTYYYFTVLPGKIIYDAVLSFGYITDVGFFQFELNTKIITKETTNETHGFLNYNILNDMHPVGTQNTICIYSSRTQNVWRVSTVLLVS